MNLLKIEISKDGSAVCETQIAGQLGEGNITRLKFIVPYAYREYYKYIDILKGDGEKTQTVAGDTESEIFYFNIPHSLTKYRELFIQLIMKKEDKIFKSKMIALHFDGSINATQYLEENYQDTIEFIMENKADKNDVKSLESKLLLKAGKSELYEINEAITRTLKDNQEKNDIRFEGLEVITDSLRDKKVDKIYGKGLSSNDYSDEEKEKLRALPGRNELAGMFDTKASVIKCGVDELSYDDYQDAGVYILVIDDDYYDMYRVETLYVWYEGADIFQAIDKKGHRIERCYVSSDAVWTDWVDTGVLFTPAESIDISNLKEAVRGHDEDIRIINNEVIPSMQNKISINEEDIIALGNIISALERQIGNVESALDELHSYAQALISGGEG